MKIIKKIPVFFLTICLLIPLASCSGSTGSTTTTIPTTTVTTKSDVLAFAQRGEMENVPVKLGETPADVKAYYHYGDPAYGYVPTTVSGQTEESAWAGSSAAAGIDESLPSLQIDDTADPVKMWVTGDGGNVTYFYKKGGNIAAIFSTAKPYGFTAGLTSDDQVTASLGAPNKTMSPTREEIFYMFTMPVDSELMIYQFGSKQLEFLFDTGGMLLGAALVDTSVFAA